MDRIEQLKAIKNNMDVERVEHQINELMNQFWKGYDNDSLYTLDLKEMVTFHQYLIDSVNTIHIGEVSEKNEKLLSEFKSFRDILDICDDGERGKDIYLINGKRSYYFVGDLHSDDVSLNDTLRRIGFFKRIETSDFKLIFVGDYVDRGKNHLKILEHLMILKYLFPELIVLLRGNHDGGILKPDRSVTLPYRVPIQDKNEWYFPLYLKTLAKKNETVSLKLLSSYLEFFDGLAYIAVVKMMNQVIYAVHGGLPRPKGESCFDYLESAGELTNPNHVDHVGKTILQNIMWSDPHRKGDLYVDSGRFRFTENEYFSFKKHFDIDMFIRGHEVCYEGYRKHFDESLITIFSSGGKLEEGFNNESAYVDVVPKVMQVSKNGEVTYI